METLASPSAGTGGRPLGTERPSAFLPSSSGELFAREVQRASERSRGDGLQARRLDALAHERRETRRSSFGRERVQPGEEAWARGATFRPEHAPVGVRPAVASAPVAPAAAWPGEPRAGAAAHVDQENRVVPPAPAGTEGVVPSAVSVPPLAPAAPGAVAPAGASPVLQATPRNEPQPAEPLQVMRSGAFKPLKAPGGQQATARPDPGVLERAHEILRQIQLHLAPGVRRVAIDLEPAALGRVAIQLALRAGKITAIVRGERSETLALLQQREGELAQLFAQRGVPADSIRFELGFAGRGSTGAPQRHAPPAAAPAGTARTAPQAAVQLLAPRSSASLVDTYA